jgi:hypothetical protein
MGRYEDGTARQGLLKDEGDAEHQTGYVDFDR